MPTPTLNQVTKAWGEAEEERRFWETHAEQMLNEHPDEFVAVFKGEVVAFGSELVIVLNALEAKGIRPRDAWIKFIVTEKHSLLL